MIQIDLLSGDKLCFEPYKGLSIMSLNGSSKKFHVDEGPLRIICDTLSHGNYHSLYNLIDSTGRKILDKGVRAITPPKQNPIKRNKRETADLQPKRSKLAVFHFV